MDYVPRRHTGPGKAPHILARKRARTKLYAMLYGACAKDTAHHNQPWLDSARLGAHLPEKADFESLVQASNFSPRQLERVNARFAQLGGVL